MEKLKVVIERLKHKYEIYEKEKKNAGEDGITDLSLACDLADSIPYLIEQIEKLQKQLDVKIMFVNNGMEEDMYILQEKVIRYEKALKAYGDEKGKIILGTLENIGRIPKKPRVD